MAALGEPHEGQNRSPGVSVKPQMRHVRAVVRLDIDSTLLGRKHWEGESQVAWQGFSGERPACPIPSFSDRSLWIAKRFYHGDLPM